MALSTRSLILLISLPVTICAAILYYLHKRDDEWDEDVEVLTTNNNKIIEIRVPVDRVASVIGRGGANIKKLQDQTNSRINFKDVTEKNTEGEFRICRVRGNLESVEKAEKLLNDLIYNQPEILTVEMWVPQSSCGRIIGRCGENIKTISSQSNAHIIVDTYKHNKISVGESKGGPDQRQVLIKGTAQEITVAQSLIKKAVDEDRMLRSTLNSRPPRVQPHANQAKQKEGADGDGKNGNPPALTPVPEAEQLTSLAGTAATTDGMIQVYVSSVAHPHAFWVQLVSPRSVELDHLVDDMTEFYSKEENKQIYKLETVKKGQIIAAPFETDNRWYRVEVYGVEDKKGEDGSPLLDIFYVDYGDSGYITQNQALELRTDFLSLRFQAIECRLANIEMNEGETKWSEEIITEFEQLVYSAQWKRIMVKICGYIQRENDKPIPIVKLFDPSLGLDAADELIKRGMARVPPSEQSSPLAKPTISISNQLSASINSSASSQTVPVNATPSSS